MHNLVGDKSRGIRYESVWVEQILAPFYASEMQKVLSSMKGLNDIKSLIQDFENLFARYIGVRYAVAVNSGSDALKLALMLSGIGRGDEVIIPSLTYQAVALAVCYCGAQPILVDASRDDLQIDPEGICRAMTSRTRAVVAAHMFGRPCDVLRIKKICQDHNVIFIEDVCQAESSQAYGKRLGCFGDMAVFSFSYYKPLSSCGGGGGMIVSNDEKIHQVRYWMEDWRDDAFLVKLGQRFAPLSFMDLVALRVKFKCLKRILESRLKIKQLYEEQLRQLDAATIFRDKPATESIPQNFVVCSNKKEDLETFLTHQDVMVQKPYTPIHHMKIGSKGGLGSFPVSDWYFNTAIHLPLYSFMPVDKAKKVVQCCQAFFTQDHDH